MKVVLSNDVEFNVTQANVRYSDLTDNENKSDDEAFNYPVVEFMADPSVFDTSIVFNNKEYFNEFTLYFGNKAKTFTGFKLYNPSIRENYSDLNSMIIFTAVTK